MLLLGICCALLPLRAQNSQIQLSSVDYSKYDTYDIVTLYDSTNVLMEESGLSHVYNHKLYRILTPAGGRDYNTVKMDYDPLSALVEIRFVTIYRKNGTVEQWDAYETDYPAPAHIIYWGARQKMVTLGRLKPGDAVVRRVFAGNRVQWRETVENKLLTKYPNAKLKSVKYSNEDTYLQHSVKIVYKFSIPQYATVGDEAIVVYVLFRPQHRRRFYGLRTVFWRKCG